MDLLDEDDDQILTEDDEPILLYQSLPDVIFEAVQAALEAEFTDITCERTRRAPVDQDSEFPRIVVLPTTAVPDETQSPGETFWRFGFVVQGYAAGDGDDDAQYAQMEMHGRVMACLQVAELGVASIMAVGGAGEFGLYDAESSALPAGQFSVSFEALAVAPSNYPFVA